jgi:integrase
MATRTRQAGHLNEDPVSRTNRASIFQAMKPLDRLWDDTVAGFYLEAGVRGRSFKVITRVKGRAGQIRHNIGGARPEPGSTIGLSVEDARKEALKVVEGAKAGLTPEAAKAQAEREAARAEALTFKAVAERYLADPLKKGGAKLASNGELARKLKKDLAVWHALPITSITHAMIDDLVRAKAVNHEPAANRLLSFIKTLFAWAKRRSLVDVNPALEVEKPGDEKSRERYLDDREIAVFWRACDKLGAPAGPLFQFMLVTAQRRGECAGLKRSELATVDYKLKDPITRAERVIAAEGWVIPAARTKRRVAQTVALSTLAKALLDAQPVLVHDDGKPFDLVFVSGRRDDRPLSGWSKFKRQLDTAIAEIVAEDGGEPLAPWHLHDLRATAATHLEDTLGIPRPVTSTILNHSLRDNREGGRSTGVYVRGSWAWQAAEALQVWADYLLTVTGQNIVDLTAKRRSA